MTNLRPSYRSFILVLAVTLAVLAGLYYLLRRPEPRAIAFNTPAPRPTPTPPQLMVDVRGAVAKPGLYGLPKGSRAQDALTAAGGTTAEANLDRVNLAKLLTDGDQVLVPTRTAQSSRVTSPTGADGPVVATGPTATPGKININTASTSELDTLPGIGPTIAQRIVDYRKTNGPFKRIEDLKNVAGIGDKSFEQIKDLIIIQ